MFAQCSCRIFSDRVPPQGCAGMRWGGLHCVGWNCFVSSRQICQWGFDWLWPCQLWKATNLIHFPYVSYSENCPTEAFTSTCKRNLQLIECLTWWGFFVLLKTWFLSWEALFRVWWQVGSQDPFQSWEVLTCVWVGEAVYNWGLTTPCCVVAALIHQAGLCSALPSALRGHEKGSTQGALQENPVPGPRNASGGSDGTWVGGGLWVLNVTVCSPECSLQPLKL